MGANSIEKMMARATVATAVAIFRIETAGFRFKVSKTAEPSSLILKSSHIHFIRLNFTKNSNNNQLLNNLKILMIKDYSPLSRNVTNKSAIPAKSFPAVLRG
jgi:hypothetical protein